MPVQSGVLRHTYGFPFILAENSTDGFIDWGDLKDAAHFGFAHPRRSAVCSGVAGRKAARILAADRKTIMKAYIKSNAHCQTDKNQDALQTGPRNQGSVASQRIQTRLLHHNLSAHTSETHPVFITADKLREQPGQITQSTQSRYGEKRDEQKFLMIFQADPSLSLQALLLSYRYLWD